MKYYLYISDSKLEMLLPQIADRNKRKGSWEFKLDFKLLSILRKTERDEDLNRIQKLEQVIDFINRFGNIGTVDQPNEYISDSLQMNWRVFDKMPNYQPCVYFGGVTNKTVVGLIGSRKHVIGHNPNFGTEPTAESASYSPDHIIQPIFDALVSSDSKIAGPTNWLTDLYCQSVDQGMTATQEVTFLAKRLFCCEPPETVLTSERRQLVIATPLYVSLNT